MKPNAEERFAAVRHEGVGRKFLPRPNARGPGLDGSRHAQFHPVEDAARVELGPGRRRRPLPARRRPAGT